MLAIEANDEWLVGRAYISQQSMAGLFAPQNETALSLKDQSEEVPSSSRPEPPRRLPTSSTPNSYTTSRDLTRTASSVSSGMLNGTRTRLPNRVASSEEQRLASGRRSELGAQVERLDRVAGQA